VPVAARAEPATVLSREIAYGDPAVLFAPFAGDRYAVLLDGATPDEAGRHSFIAVEPFQVLESRGRRTTVDGRDRAGDPFRVLGAELARFPSRAEPELPPFQGGAVGILGYELGGHLERLPPPRAPDMGLPDMAMLFCDVVVALDHRERRAFILSSGHPETGARARAERARARLEAVARRLRGATALPDPPSPDATPEIGATVDRAAYERGVRRAVSHILAGDVFQVNLAQRFTAGLPGGLTPFDLFRRLRAVNPAPFAAHLALGDAAVVSSSPERFLRLDDGWVETRPIKGTRPRGATPERDEALAAELLASEKDRAENVMIVDLLRNDLSRVCMDGSVAVPRLCALERFATVMHLVSRVTGRLRPGAGAVDLLAACFPGGSITGAPKIRAMEIIAELEPVRRGPYCGGIAYLGFDGAMDSSIVIRSYAVRRRRVSFHAGAGIVADSRPEDEYEETLAKARALVAALSPDGAETGVAWSS
jgi:para-aminobenzoate synthetase component 1